MTGKIRKPFIILLVVFPLVTLLFFNAAVRIYLNRNMRNELRAVAEMTGTVMARELPGNLRDFNESNLNRVFAKLYKAMNASRLSVNVDLLLYNRNNRLIYPSDDTGDSVDDKLADRISNRLPGMKDKNIYTIRIGPQKYLVLPYTPTGSGTLRPTAVFVARMEAATLLIRSINLILICIMFISAAAASLIAGRLAANIAKPVAELSGITQKIGKGSLAFPLQPDKKSDIFEIDTLYRNIGEMAARLDAYDKTQKTFLQNASHELKTPLMSIQGYAEGIANGVLPDVKNAAEIIRSESVRLGALVEELLMLSRIESQTYAKELVTINLCDILKEYVQRMGGIAAKQRRRILLAAPDFQLNVQAQDALLSRAVMNILSNCLRYAKTAVNIELSRAEAAAVIRISDDGGGIPEDDLPHIFKRFYKGKGGNFGLGLAIAKSAVEFMGGSVRAYNGDIGAVFEITLPLAEN